MNYMMRQIVYKILQLTTEKSKLVPGSIYEERINSRPDFYRPIIEYLKERADEEEAKRAKQ